MLIFCVFSVFSSVKKIFERGIFLFIKKLLKKIPEKNFNKTENYKINFYSVYLTKRCAHDKIQL